MAPRTGDGHSSVASHNSSLNRLEIEDLISYGRQGEQQRLQAALELFWRKEIRLQEEANRTAGAEPLRFGRSAVRGFGIVLSATPTSTALGFGLPPPSGGNPSRGSTQ
jgi:hypothetical protein